MTNKQSYNGWTNYETWVVNLWLTNDQGSDEQLRDDARYHLEQAIEKGCDTESARNDAAYELGQSLREQHEEFAPELTGVFSDLLRASLRAVNWYEIGRAAIDDLTIYSAGWNMPGYLPDAEPQIFLDADDALEHIKDAAKDSIEDYIDADDLAQKIDDWRADRHGEFGQTFGNYHYFVTRI